MLLGKRPLQKKTFSRADDVLKNIKKMALGGEQARLSEVNRALLELIQKEDEPCFLLSSVLDFIEKAESFGILEHYTMESFELWLNQFSNLGAEENLRIRGKIVGKWVDRSAYQVFFPIGMGKVYEGTHFVTAHKSPDLDTTIASFWGWVDAFGARVGNALHIWNLPGGPPSGQIETEMVFSDVFGKAVFTHLPKTRNALNLTGSDLVGRGGMVLRKLDDSIAPFDHEKPLSATVVVDEEGFYLGDWRSFDAEEVRSVILMLSASLRWFENHIHLNLISFFATPKPRFDLIKSAMEKILAMPLSECEPIKDLSAKQRKELAQFVVKVLGLEEGLSTSFEKMGMLLAKAASISFRSVEQILHAVKELFHPSGELKADLPQIFSFLEVAVSQLHEAIFKIRTRLEKLDVAMKTKTEVFDRHPAYVTIRSDVEEIRQKMGNQLFLTVASHEGAKMFPLGVVHAQDLRKNVLGTVSLRDFCNRDEMSIPPYLDIISVIDHHKSQLQTTAPPFAVIADAQSSNTLVARQAFEINDRYGSGGFSLEKVEGQIREIANLSTPEGSRLMQRLLQKRNVLQRKTDHFVHAEREFLEYLHFLYGILDDTDLLSKVSVLDVECVASLLNRMKSIAMGKEEEVVSLDDLPRDKDFSKKAAARILQNEEMYSLYSKVYEHREKEVSDAILAAAEGKGAKFFADTKVQNGCCRVGQTKIFVGNVSCFSKHAEKIQQIWVDESVRLHKEKSEVDLHIHMVSTIISAEEVYKGTYGHYPHKDEMWIWIPNLDTAVERLKRFLSTFQNSPGLKNNSLEAEFMGPLAKEYQIIFKDSFLEIPSAIHRHERSFAILRYKAGSLNSRKAMISPFLPTL